MYYIIHNNKQKISWRMTLSSGFVLIELSLVIAMIGIIAMFTLPLGTNFLWRTDLNSAVSLTIASLRHAQLLAQTETDDMDWGVHFEDNQLILFQGNNFINRDVQNDEEYDLGSVVAQDSVDVIYHKFSGHPYGGLNEINLTTNDNVIILTISEEGVINY